MTTTADRIRRMASEAEQDVFFGAMLISKLEQMAEEAKGKDEEIRKAMKAGGLAAMVEPQLVIDFWAKVLAITTTWEKGDHKPYPLRASYDQFDMADQPDSDIMTIEQELGLHPSQTGA